VNIYIRSLFLFVDSGIERVASEQGSSRERGRRSDASSRSDLPAIGWAFRRWQAGLAQDWRPPRTEYKCPTSGRHFTQFHPRGPIIL